MKLVTQENRKWWVLAVIALGLFMVVLDGNVVALAIPRILEDFHSSISSVEWILNGYLLSFAIFLITFGRLGDMFGRRLLFGAGIIFFMGGSFLCGHAGSINELIVFRVIQGLGGAAMMPATLSLISANFPKEQRGTALGIWGAVSGLAIVAGPILGGYMTDRGLGSFIDKFLHIGQYWRYVFYINLPVGLLGLLGTIFLVKESRDRERFHKIDYLGILLSALFIFPLTFAFVEGQKFGWWKVNIPYYIKGHLLSFGDLSLIPYLFALALIFGVLFILYERTVKKDPMVDVALFSNRNFTIGNSVTTVLAFAMFGSFFLLPLFLQGVLGYSAIRSGEVLLPLAIMIMIAAPLAGRLADRFGAKWLIFMGMLTMFLGIFYVAHFTVDTQSKNLILPFIIIGLGMGFSLAPSSTITLLDIPPKEFGGASGIYGTTRQIGSVMGIAILGAILQTTLSAKITSEINSFPGIPDQAKSLIIDSAKASSSGLSGGVDYQKELSKTFSNSPSAKSAPTPVERQNAQNLVTGIEGEVKESFVDSINHTFRLASIFPIFGALLALLFKNKKGSDDKTQTPGY